MTKKRLSLTFVLLLHYCLFPTVYAQESQAEQDSSGETSTDLKKQVKSRSGYEPDEGGYGSQASVGKQLYLDSIFIPDRLRFPEFDKSIQPYFEWKRKVFEQYDLQFGQDYTSLYQKASESLTDTDSASAGVYRFYGRWLATGKGTNNIGALVFKIEHSHKYGSIPPDALNKEIGYLGETGFLYSDLGWVLNDFNWQQRFDDGKGRFVLGRADPTDYMDVVDYANPWTTFQNQNVLENRSIAIPDTGFGVGVAYAFYDHWYTRVGVSDANGNLDNPSFFEQGAEFFSFADFGWTPTLAERDLKDIHITLWHVDQRVDENVPEGDGVALGASWSFDKEWIIFGRSGQSRGGASMMKRSTTVGVSHIWKSYLDVFGLAVNYSEPADDKLREQTTMETFLKIRFAQNIAITPSFQWLINPALNPQQDNIQIYGLRVRITL